MAKAKSGSSDMMGGSAGMSPRKAMASGMTEAKDVGGNFGVKSFGDANGHAGEHPDHKMRTGEKGAMADGDRAIGDPISHTKGHLPAQAAPMHGPTHVDGYMHK